MPGVWRGGGGGGVGVGVCVVGGDCGGGGGVVVGGCCICSDPRIPIGRSSHFVKEAYAADQGRRKGAEIARRGKKPFPPGLSEEGEAPCLGRIG